jgi:hypothetical protein
MTADWSWARFPKGNHKREKRQKRQQAREWIGVVRELVFRLDPRCVVCGGAPTANDEMHEIVPRSKTRGLPPEQRFNRGNCVRLHGHCHREVTENRTRLTFLEPKLGVDGGLLVRRGGRETFYFRIEVRHERSDHQARDQSREEADDSGETQGEVDGEA